MHNSNPPSLMHNSNHHAGHRFATSASIALLSLLPLLSAACHTSHNQLDETVAAENPSATADTETLEITFKRVDARLLANYLRIFQGSGLQASIEAPNPGIWMVSGTASDVRALQILARVFDAPGGPSMTHGLVGRVYKIEHQDARLLAHAAWGQGDQDSSARIIASPEGWWYVILPENEVEAFELWLAEMDSPNGPT